MDSLHCKGLQTRAHRGSQAVTAAFPTPFECQSARPSRGRDCQPLRQESHTASSLPQQSLLQQPFPSGEERGRATPSDELVHTKLICVPPSFQDGGLESGCGQPSSSGLHVQNRPQGRVFCHSYPPGTPKATLLSVQECNLPVQMPSLRSHFSTSCLHKSAEGPDSLCQETGAKDMYLPRRHANPKFSEGGSYERCIADAPPVGKSGVCCEYGQMEMEMEFLGVLVSSIHMSFSLPESKVLNLRNDCRRLLSSRTASQSELARLIGKMIAAKAAVFQAPLHYRALQHQKNFLDHQGVPLHQKVILDIEAILDLEWWVTNLATANSRPVKPLLPDLLIQSDASGSGWGAVCNRIETRGTWSLHESSLHINCLELLAATLAIKAFTKSLNNAHVLIQMDNTSAIAYVNKMGGAKQGVLDKHARSLWEWCLTRKITLRAEHIPGRLNVIADAESRAKPDAADWKLDSDVFKVLNHIFGPFTVDLFANRNNTQLERFYSYLPDPLAEQYDALVQPWREENAYAFPPFNLISKCLRKVSLEGATLLIICPVWPAQAWYPHLLQLLTDNPVLLPTHNDLLLDPLGNRHPMIVNNSLPLAGWRLSGNTSLQRAYQKKLQIFSSLPNVDQQMLSTSPVGLSGVARVANDRLIPFVQL